MSVKDWNAIASAAMFQRSAKLADSVMAPNALAERFKNIEPTPETWRDRLRSRIWTLRQRLGKWIAGGDNEYFTGYPWDTFA